MKEQVPFRVIVTRPLSGVVMKVQKGRDELLDASFVSDVALVFEFELSVDPNCDPPNFLGKFAQGPKDSRFVYVNSGTYGGQANTTWGRRAKLSLMSITLDQIKEVLADPTKKIIEASMPGVGRDGGPTCASVKALEWKVVER